MNVTLDTILIYVKNVELLKNFYVESFNFKIIEEDPSWVLLNTGATRIGLHKIGDQYLEQLNDDYNFDNNTKLIFSIDIDIVLARDRLLSQNIPMRDIKTFDNYDFYLCDGTDPEGNVFQIKSKKHI